MSVSFCLSVSFSFILLRKPYLSPLITAVQRNKKIFYYSLKSLPLACNGHGTRMQVSRMYTSNNRWRHWDQFSPFILPFYAFKTCCGRYSTNSETFLAYLFIAVFFCSYRFAFYISNEIRIRLIVFDSSINITDLINQSTRRWHKVNMITNLSEICICSK